MNTHEIELPPLPQGEYRLSPDSRAPTLYDEEMMEAYARAAIEADRKRKGVNSTHTLGEPECNHCGGTGDVSGEYPGVACPACAGTGKAPQPAEPVKVPSDDCPASFTHHSGQLTAPVNWQPIRTAPTDGSRRLYLARIDEDGELVELDFDGRCVDGRWIGARGVMAATHWVLMI